MLSFLNPLPVEFMGGSPSSAVFPSDGEQRLQITVSPITVCKSEVKVKATVVDSEGKSVDTLDTSVVVHLQGGRLRFALCSKRYRGTKLTRAPDSYLFPAGGDILTVSKTGCGYTPAPFIMRPKFANGGSRIWFEGEHVDYPAFVIEWIDAQKMFTFTLHWQSYAFQQKQAQSKLLAVVEHVLAETNDKKETLPTISVPVFVPAAPDGREINLN